MNQRTLKTLAVAAALIVGLNASQAGQSSSQNWATMWVDNGAGVQYYLLNAGYDMPSGAYISGWINSPWNWGGTANLYGKTGGIAVQINYGQYPWNSQKTAGSSLPRQVQDGRKITTEWGYNLSNLSGQWNSFIEIWIHSSSSIGSGNVVCDLMILPNYDYIRGNVHHTFTSEGEQWKCVYWPSVNGSAPLVMYYRVNKGNYFKRSVSAFWKDAASWQLGCKWTDWVGSITSGIETKNGGNGSISTFNYSVWSN
jgi:hypothetical protein